MRLAGAWVAMGREVTIFCGTREGPLHDLVPAGINVVEMSPPIRRSLSSRLRLGKAAARSIDQYVPDIVFAPGNFHLPVLAVLLRHLRCCAPKSFIKISNPLSRRRTGWRAGFSAVVTRFLARRVDAFVAMSVTLADEARAVLPHARIASIPEPNLDADSDRPGKPSAISSSPLIVAAGRFVPQKDFGLAVRSFAALGESSTARLLLLGDGPLKSKVEGIADRNGCKDRISFMGFVPDIRPYLQGARLLLLSSHFEGYPAVVVEALAVGVPVVATDCSAALRELIPGPEFGEIVGDRSPEAIAAAIRRQLGRPMPDVGKLADKVRHNRLEPSARAYLTLFDAVAAA